ncbi:MAG: hypothetical protein VX278_04135 [Myxococcota bacterium]|nr:hypothetical protein [Myxococcota bacterium]
MGLWLAELSDRATALSGRARYAKNLHTTDASMKSSQTPFERLYEALLGEDADDRLRSVVLFFSVAGFLGHLSLWFLCWTGSLEVSGEAASLVSSPLSSLYTPFSILLAYEIYELIRAIPTSFSSAIGKQYEVVTLLVVRDVFKRLSEVEFSGEWHISTELGLIIIECVTFSLLFFTALRYQAYSKSKRNVLEEEEINRFVYVKQMIAMILFFTFFIVAATSLTGWIQSVAQGAGSVGREIFFLDFFTSLILADILILLFSYRYSDNFANLARNTGFVLSTVILRVAIGAPGFSSMVLFILSAVLGLTIIQIAKKFLPTVEASKETPLPPKHSVPEVALDSTSKNTESASESLSPPSTFRNKTYEKSKTEIEIDLG